MVERSHFKSWIIILFLLLGACSEQEELNFRSTGIPINDSTVLIDPINLDSTLFASGEMIWTLSSSFQLGTKKYPYRIFSESSPSSGKLRVFKASHPELLDADIVECICTIEGKICKITWRSSNQSVYLKTSIISEH